jgi:hypothetical protein
VGIFSAWSTTNLSTGIFDSTTSGRCCVPAITPKSRSPRILRSAAIRSGAPCRRRRPNDPPEGMTVPASFRYVHISGAYRKQRSQADARNDNAADSITAGLVASRSVFFVPGGASYSIAGWATPPGGRPSESSPNQQISLIRLGCDSSIGASCEGLIGPPCIPDFGRKPNA